MFSVLICTMVNINSYTLYHKKFSGVLGNFWECVKGSWFQNAWEPPTYCVPVGLSASSPSRGKGPSSAGAHIEGEPGGAHTRNPAGYV